MLYANITPKNHEQLTQAMKQSKNIQEYQRLHIIQLSSKGKTVPELADLFERCTATIRDYIKRYNTGGLKYLKRQSSGGAPVQIPFNQAQWEALLCQSPSQFERLNTVVRNWSQVLIVAYLYRYHGITVTRQAVAANLKRHGIRLNRGRLKVTSPDPLYTIKRNHLDALKKKPNKAF
jgi:transposase